MPISVMRRDGLVTIKRKLPGGPSNGGTYVTLASDRSPDRVSASGIEVRVETTDRDGAVLITLWLDDVAVLEAVDAGDLAAPITGPTGIGLRADNIEAYFDDLVISRPSA